VIDDYGHFHFCSLIIDITNTETTRSALSSAVPFRLQGMTAGRTCTRLASNISPPCIKMAITDVIATHNGERMLPFAFIRIHWPLLLYGWLMSFFSGFGQTYFISIFGGLIRADFGLDHAAYGSAYSIGTLVSGCMLLWFGRLIDRISLRVFSLAAVFGLACGAIFMGFATGIVGLTLTFFLLRFFGQGLMTHSAITTMGRYFTSERGSAISFAVTGHMTGGAVLPLIGVTLMAVWTWRQIWIAGGIALALLTMPVVAWLLARAARVRPELSRDRAERTDELPAQPDPNSRALSRDWTLAEAMLDRGLYVCLAVLLAPAFITTGLIFHQVQFGAQKGWGLGVVATALSVYAVGSFVTTLIVGRLVDRFTARRMVPIALGPMALACMLLTVATSPSGALVFFGLLGFGSGATTVLMGAIWAELYGTAHLGAIRSFAATGSVFASGLAPGIFGLLLDWHWNVNVIAVSCAVYCVGASIAAGLLSRRPSPT
jgi:MFS family permease